MGLQVSHAAFRDTFLMLETFERTLNLAGYIPVIGSISAVIRGGYAKIEMITGIAFAIFSVLHGDPTTASIYLSVGVTLIAHSLLNAIRMCFELVPFMPLVTTLPYDLYATYVVGRRFFPYV